MAQEDDKEIRGGCYCGEVRFLIPSGVRPVMSGYCHCIDCRQAHATPMCQFVYVQESEFQITQGVDFVKWYLRSAADREFFKRYFCVNCGTKVYNVFSTVFHGKQASLVGAFQSLFDDQRLARSERWVAQVHTFCAESLIDLSTLNDGLPRLPRKVVGVAEET